MIKVDDFFVAVAEICPKHIQLIFGNQKHLSVRRRSIYNTVANGFLFSGSRDVINILKAGADINLIAVFRLTDILAVRFDILRPFRTAFLAEIALDNLINVVFEHNPNVFRSVIA